MKKLICSLVLASGGLFITALIPIEANAARLTFSPVNEVEKKPGDTITFKVMLDPMEGNADRDDLRFERLSYDYDGGELSLNNEKWLVELNELIGNTRTLIEITFDVIKPVKGGKSDLSDVIAYYNVPDKTGKNGERKSGEVSADETVDVVPVPEPTTIFGSAIFLGVGGWLKRKKSSKSAQ